MDITVIEKSGLKSFLTQTKPPFPSIFFCFYQKLFRNHDKHIHDLKSQNNHLKNQNQPEIKNQTELGLFFHKL
jgi:hypothetical protein